MAEYCGKCAIEGHFFVTFHIQINLNLLGKRGHKGVDVRNRSSKHRQEILPKKRFRGKHLEIFFSEVFRSIALIYKPDLYFSLKNARKKTATIGAKFESYPVGKFVTDRQSQKCCNCVKLWNRR